jgi:hypothetical protein
MSLISGGWLVSYGPFNELITHYYLLYTIAGLFIFGGVLGILFGGALGMFGRPLAMNKLTALKDQLKGMLYTIPAAGIGFVIAGWMGLTFWAIYSINLIAIGLVSISWLISLIVISLAMRYGWFGINNVVKRISNINLKKIKIKIELSD